MDGGWEIRHGHWTWSAHSPTVRVPALRVGISRNSPKCAQSRTTARPMQRSGNPTSGASAFWAASCMMVWWSGRTVLFYVTRPRKPTVGIRAQRVLDIRSSHGVKSFTQKKLHPPASTEGMHAGSRVPAPPGGRSAGDFGYSRLLPHRARTAATTFAFQARPSPPPPAREDELAPTHRVALGRRSDHAPPHDARTSRDAASGAQAP